MIKNDLREQGFSVFEKHPKHSKITAIWVFFTLVLITSTFIISLLIVGLAPGFEDSTLIVRIVDSFDEILGFPVPYAGYMLLLILLVAVYFISKLIMTILFCRDKNNSIKLKFLSDKTMPVCYCREAMRVWQIMLIYLAPVVLINSLVFRECLLNASHPGLMFVLFFMSFFTAYDLTLVLYVLFIKIKDGADYISIDHHIYEITLFKKTYVKFKRKAIKNQFLAVNNKYLENGKFKWR